MFDLLQQINSTNPIGEGVDARYKIGPGHVELKDVDLVGLQHEDEDLWQVYVRLRALHSNSAEQRVISLDQLHL